MDVVCLCPLRAATLLWQPAPDRWARTVVVKATYRIQPGISPLAEEQEDIAPTEAHWDDDPKRSLYAPSDLVPFKPKADVVLVGSAFAPNTTSVRSIVVRLRVRDIDKGIEVFSARLRTRDGEIREGARWTKMPLLYERAAGGPDTGNPVGISMEGPPDIYGQRQLPNLQPPGLHITGDNLEIPSIGFGPVAASWYPRAIKLGRGYRDKDWAQQPFGEGFDGAFFQAAPADQQLDKLRPDERLVLENLHPEHARLVTHLPNIEPQVLFEPREGASREVPTTPDTLWIDTARGICTLTFRGRVELSLPDEKGRFVVAMGKSGYRPNWPKILENAPPLAPEPKPESRAVPDPRPSERRAPSERRPAVDGRTPAEGRPAVEARQAVESRSAIEPRVVVEPRGAVEVRPPAEVRAPVDIAVPAEAGTAADEELPARLRRPQTLRLPAGPSPERPTLPFQPAPPGRPVPASIPSMPAQVPPGPKSERERRQTQEIEAPRRSTLPPWLKRDSSPLPPPPPAPVYPIEEIEADPTDDGPGNGALAAAPAPVPPPPLVASLPMSPAMAVSPPLPISPAMAVSPPLPISPPLPVSAPPPLSPSMPMSAPLPISPPLPVSPPLVAPPPSLGPLVPSSSAVPLSSSVQVSPPALAVPPPPPLGASRPAEPAMMGMPSLLGASNAAAGVAAKGDGAPAEARSRSTAPGPATSIELLWFEPPIVPVLRKHPVFSPLLRAGPEGLPAGKAPAGVGAEDPQRLHVFDILTKGTPKSGRDLESGDLGDEDGPSAPLVLLRGDVDLPFDEVELLKAVTAAARPQGASDKKLKEVLDQVDETLKSPMRGLSEVASGLTARVREAWLKTNRQLAASYIDTTPERMLLEQRAYQKRDLLDGAWIRALLSGEGFEAPIPLYLPVKLEKRLPLFKRFAARVIAHVHPSQDQFETCPLALQAVALGRVVPARPRPSREPR